MTWVAEIKKHRDYFKNHHTEVTTYITKTKEEAETLAVLYMMEDLSNNDYYTLTKLDSAKLNEALLSKDFSRMYEALESCTEKLWWGEYVNPTLEVEVYERVKEDYDEPSPEDIADLFETINDLMGVDEDEDEGDGEDAQAGTGE